MGERKRCRPWSHDWTKRASVDVDSEWGITTMQTRACVRCGLRRRRRI